MRKRAPDFLVDGGGPTTDTDSPYRRFQCDWSGPLRMPDPERGPWCVEAEYADVDGVRRPIGVLIRLIDYDPDGADFLEATSVRRLRLGEAFDVWRREWRSEATSLAADLPSGQVFGAPGVRWDDVQHTLEDIDRRDRAPYQRGGLRGPSREDLLRLIQADKRAAERRKAGERFALNEYVGRELGISKHTVPKWRKRAKEQGLV